jgi:hypothetical protein
MESGDYLNVLVEKLKDVLMSVVPITVIVLILNFTLTPLEIPLLIRFLLGATCIIIGLTIFLTGADIGITPIGSLMGANLTKTNKAWIVGIGGFILGFIVCIAEPSLLVLGEQVGSVTGGAIPKLSIVLSVSIGVGLLLATGFLRIVYNFPLYKLLTIIYTVILLLSFISSPNFLAVAFEASAAVTGALVVPFIMALAIGVSRLKKDSKASEEDSFGLVGLSGLGGLLSVMVMGIVFGADTVGGDLDATTTATVSILGPFLANLPRITGEVFFALLPIILIFIIFQQISFKLSKRTYHRILKGLLYTFVGLILFLLGVNAGFMDVGSVIGHNLASFDNKAIVVIVGLVLGLVTILAEPAVYVLTHQIEDVTGGSVPRRLILIALCLGVGSAVGLSVLRIVVPAIKFWHYVLPGYALAVGMMYIVPKLFVGIAFDSGAVASGPMCATFLLAFTQGAAAAAEGANVLIDGFGVIATVALMPVITLEVVGLIYKAKTAKEGLPADDESSR